MLQLLSILASLSRFASSGKAFFGNVIAMIVVAGLGAYGGINYVTTAHAQTEINVKNNAEQIVALNEAKNQMTTALQLINGNLKNMKVALGEVKISVKNTESQTIQIYRDLLKMKNGD